MVSISSAFDSGAIEIDRIDEQAGVVDCALRIRRDSHADFTQWFHFRLQGAQGRRCSLRLTNAGACTYPDGWDDYRAVASYDGESWFRVPTVYRDGVLTIDVECERNSMYFAYFEPYSWERHLRLLGRAESSPRARTVRLGTTHDGRDFDAIEFVLAGPKRPQVWLIARQHPGEAMAEWFVEGWIDRLLDDSDPVARAILAMADVHIVPNMNPDGSVRGNLRTSATGANLNREWLEPSLERSPEVHLVRERMKATGVDLFIDAHGDEALPYNFVAGSEMLPDFTEAQRVAQAGFVASLKAASPDFQDRYGYAASKYSTDVLKLASKWVGHHFGCLSLTLEMPFKDNADLPDARVGWNGARSKRLGAAALIAVLAHLRRLSA